MDNVETIVGLTCDMAGGEMKLPVETVDRPMHRAEELEEAYKAYQVNKFTKEEAYEIARRHHWRVVVYAPPRSGAGFGKYYYLKGENMSRDTAIAKIHDPTVGPRSGNPYKWTALMLSW
jgi:hypothetical protein